MAVRKKKSRKRRNPKFGDYVAAGQRALAQGAAHVASKAQEAAEKARARAEAKARRERAHVVTPEEAIRVLAQAHGMKTNPCGGAASRRVNSGSTRALRRRRVDEAEDAFFAREQAKALARAHKPSQGKRRTNPAKKPYGTSEWTGGSAGAKGSRHARKVFRAWFLDARDGWYKTWVEGEFYSRANAAKAAHRAWKASGGVE